MSVASTARVRMVVRTLRRPTRRSTSPARDSQRSWSLLGAGGVRGVTQGRWSRKGPGATRAPGAPRPPLPAHYASAMADNAEVPLSQLGPFSRLAHVVMEIAQVISPMALIGRFVPLLKGPHLIT